MWHGTRRVTDKPAKRCANKRSWRKAQLAARSGGISTRPTSEIVKIVELLAAGER